MPSAGAASMPSAGAASMPSAGAASSAGASVVASSAGASSAFSGEHAERARMLAAAKTGLSLMMDFMVLFPFVAETRARVVSTPLGLWQDIFLALAREGHARGPTPFPRTLGNRAYSRLTIGGKEDKMLAAHASFSGTTPGGRMSWSQPGQYQFPRKNARLERCFLHSGGWFARLPHPYVRHSPYRI